MGDGRENEEILKVYEECVTQICKEIRVRGKLPRDQRERGLSMDEVGCVKEQLEKATEAVVVPVVQPKSRVGGGAFEAEDSRRKRERISLFSFISWSMHLY